MSLSSIIVALALLAISGGLFRYGVYKQGTRMVYLIYFVATVILIVFIFLVFKGCTESTDPYRGLGQDVGG